MLGHSALGGSPLGGSGLGLFLGAGAFAIAGSPVTLSLTLASFDVACGVFSVAFSDVYFDLEQRPERKTTDVGFNFALGDSITGVSDFDVSTVAHRRVTGVGFRFSLKSTMTGDP